MRKLLIPLFAAVALPNAVNAKSYYLFGRNANQSFIAPMDSEELCEKAGKKFITRESWTGDKAQWGWYNYVCVRAK